jgi:outer membrane protein assembly factor BamB
LIRFAITRPPADAPTTTPAKHRFGTIELANIALGNISASRRGILAGNDKGELCVFSFPHGQAKKEVIPLSDHPISAPVIEHDGVCYVGDDAGRFYAYDLDKGLKWSYQTGNKIAGCALWAKDRIVVGSYDQKLYAFDPQDGKLLYAVTCDSFINGSAVLSDSADFLFFGSCDGAIRKIKTQTGEVTGKIVLSSPIPASPVMFDDVLYALTHDGSLVAIQTDPFKILYEVALSSTYTSSPYATNQFLFLTDDDGRMRVYAREDGRHLSTLETTEKMTPVQAADKSEFYVVSKRGKLFEYRRVNEQWECTLLHDFQTDYQAGCIRFEDLILLADKCGGLYYYEVLP